MTASISLKGILLLLLITLPIIIFDKHYKLKLYGKFYIAVLRMIGQLFLVGIYLQYIFNLNIIIINILYIITMIFIASFSVLNSTGLRLKKFIIPIFFSIFIPQFFILIFFNYFIIHLNNLFEAKYMITIGGMLLGNCLNGNIIGLNNYYNELRENEETYLYMIALGAEKNEALREYLLKAVKATVLPTIASIATIGLVSLPGMMTGQILGGSLPLTAIKYQIGIMIAIFIAKFYSILLSIYFTNTIAFDEYDVLKKDIFRI